MTDSLKLKRVRMKANDDLLATLAALIEQYGDTLRFGQILSSFGFIQQVKAYDERGNFGDSINVWADEYNLEPMELLERVKDACAKVIS